MTLMKKDQKYPFKTLPPGYLRKLDDCLERKGGGWGQKMHRGRRYAILEGYMSEAQARKTAKEIINYSSYGAAAFKIGNAWGVGIRQWKK